MPPAAPSPRRPPPISPEVAPAGPPEATRPVLPGSLVALMATTVGTMAANNYYSQPLLPTMARTFGVSAAAIGLVAAATQVGYMLGLLVLAPLGDRYDRKPLILWHFAGLVIALLSLAVAPTLGIAVAASVVVGLLATITHQVIPFAATLATPETRGRVVGTLMAGLTIGLLLARTVSGVVGQHLGWRAVYGGAAGLAVGIGALVAWQFPHSRPSTTLGLGAILRSMGTLVRAEPVLREAATVGALWFAAFNVFWATLALHVAAPPFGYGAQAAGLFGLVGVVGAAASRVAGRWTDRVGARPVITRTLAVIAAAFVVLGLRGHSLAGLVLGIVLLDLGVFAGQVANQTRVFALHPDARSRLNSVYMVTYYAGGALGSAVGTWAWAHLGWGGVWGAGLAFTTGAVAVHWVSGRAPGPGQIPSAARPIANAP